MDRKIILVALISILLNNGAATKDEKKYNHIARRSTFDFDPHEVGGIIGAPSRPEHLPGAEPILPGHTLLRPSMGMLKSAVKFPHRELENGFGVLGNWDNLGTRWNGNNERVLYTGFRRMPADYPMVSSSQDRNHGNQKPRFTVSNLILDLDDDKDTESQIVKRLKKIKKNQIPAKEGTYFVVLATPLEEKSHQERHYKKENSIFKSRFIKKKPNLLRTKEETYSSSEENEDTGLLKLRPKVKEEKSSNISVWNNKELFNTISQDSISVPDVSQINLPIGLGKPLHSQEGKYWWYYNQDDFLPFIN